MMKDKSNLSIGLGGVALVASALYTIGRLVTGIHSYLGGSSPFASFPIYVDFALAASLWLVWMEVKKENVIMERKLETEKIAREGVLDAARELVEEASRALTTMMEHMHATIKDENKQALEIHMREIKLMYEAQTQGIDSIREGLAALTQELIKKGLSA